MGEEKERKKMGGFQYARLVEGEKGFDSVTSYPLVSDKVKPGRTASIDIRKTTSQSCATSDRINFTEKWQTRARGRPRQKHQEI